MLKSICSVIALLLFSISMPAFAASYLCEGGRGSASLEFSFTTLEDLEGYLYGDGDELSNFYRATLIATENGKDVFEVSEDGYGGATLLTFDHGTFPSNLPAAFYVKAEHQTCSELGCHGKFSATLQCERVADPAN